MGSSFNRRFSPHVIRMKTLLDGMREPKSFVYTVNAGEIPQNHWTQDRAVGGGRIIGEACHFIDLLRFLAGTRIADVRAVCIDGRGGGVNEDKVSVTLTFSDGSVGTAHYLAHGHRLFPKGRLEVFGAGRVLQLNNFRNLKGYGWKGLKSRPALRQDTGHKDEVAAFVQAVQSGGPSPIPFDELVEVTRVSLQVDRVVRGLRT